MDELDEDRDAALSRGVELDRAPPDAPHLGILYETCFNSKLVMKFTTHLKKYY